MLQDMVYAFAHDDFYEPVGSGDPGSRYLPTRPPGGWLRRDHDVWVSWSPVGAELPDQGWKIHVSTTMANAQHVLDVVTAACAGYGVPFKHLAGRSFFLMVHGKHANRAQGGKFCAIYPPTPQLTDKMLRTLERELSGIEGPYVLTDRRFGEAKCVSYRYGAFVGTTRLQADGTMRHMMRAVDGAEILDERRPEFVLPPGVIDPFAPVEPVAGDGDVTFSGYTFESVLQHSNAGGAYRARNSDGGEVFIKEARAHNGYAGDGTDAKARLEREYLTLRALHAMAPGICPQPYQLFGYWEHTYLVTELVPGKSLVSWMVANTPTIKVGMPREEFAEYYRRCTSIVDQLKAILTRLHAAGYAFLDLSPRNVMVDDNDVVRLVDFETAARLGEPVGPMGTPGYQPPELSDPATRAQVDAVHVDEFALSAIVQLLLFPMHEVARRNPEALNHLRSDLAELAPVPRELWRAMTRYKPRIRGRRMPSPQQVRQDPLTHLRELRDRTADALTAMADLDHPNRIYPTVADGYRTNTRCVAFGTAGVLHALRVAGRKIDSRVVARLRDESLAAVSDTAPGLFVGSAGISWVLADLGEQDAAARLLDAAYRHDLVRRSGHLYGGAAGVAMAELAAYCRDDDAGHLDRAEELLGRIPDGDELVGWLGQDDASGLSQGRPGIALALYYLGRLTGSKGPIERGLRLLRDELRHAQPMKTDALGFRLSTVDKRNMPYLFCGSAGYAAVLARFQAWRPSEEFAEPLEQCLRAATVRMTAHSGLFQGQAGLGLVLGETADILGRPELARAEIDAGRGLFKYSVPGESGVRWMGQQNMRLSADLWTGSAGLLVALHRMTSGQRDVLFTLDTHVDRAGATRVARPQEPALALR